MNRINKTSLYVVVPFLLFAVWNTAFADANTERPQYFDSSINEIYLEDGKSALAVLGKDRLDNIFRYFEKLSLPDFRYPLCNKDKTEVFEVIFHPGGSKYEFMEFRVYSANGSQHQSGEVLNSFHHFVSGKGIKLGLNKDQVVSILGPKFEARIHGESTKFGILTYPFPSVDSSLYYYECIFQGDKLIEFSFGYTYP